MTESNKSNEYALPLVEHSLPLVEHSSPLVEHSLPLVEHSLPLVEHSLVYLWLNKMTMIILIYSFQRVVKVIWINS